MTGESSLEKETFSEQAQTFLSLLFDKALEQGLGEIELRTFKPAKQYFVSSVNEAVEIAHSLCDSESDVYIGVNPRVGRGGKKENVEWLTAFHAEVDYGEDGHKKPTFHKTYDDALSAISAFPLTPTLIVHSGGGFHAYWVLREAVKAGDAGIPQLESINSALCQSLGGDSGTQDISRVLRVPGTYNSKIEETPRKVEIVSDSGIHYDYGAFKELPNSHSHNQPSKTSALHLHSGFAGAAATLKPLVHDGTLDAFAVESLDDYNHLPSWDGRLESLPVSHNIKTLIVQGNDRTYSSRSEADMAVTAVLVNKGFSDSDIRKVFELYPIGEKYREHPRKESYLKHNIEKAKTYSDLTEAERMDPRFISGALVRGKKATELDVVKFQEYLSRKHHLKNIGGTFFRYNGRWYEKCGKDEINALCQKELNTYRKLFHREALNDFMHYATGTLITWEELENDTLNHLTFMNGIFSFKDRSFDSHTPDIFTLNCLPFDYDQKALYPRWEKFLEEVFEGDNEKIRLIQEAVGYCFYRAIPVSVAFFLIGPGSNGKSVFLNILRALFGTENTCSIRLSDLTDEYYVDKIMGKMVNLSTETPTRKLLYSDIFKAISGGDPVMGRKPFESPREFRPYAKHFYAMNRFTEVDDNSYAFWRRIKVVEFNRTFKGKECDPYLEDKLSKELPGIWNWAYEGYQRLLSKDFEFTEASTVLKANEKHQEQSNPLMQFKAEQMKKEPGQETLYGKAYEAYTSFCTENGYHSLPKKDFKAEFVGEGVSIERSGKLSGKFVIKGYKLLNAEIVS